MTNAIGFNAFQDQWQSNAQLALDTIAMRQTGGIPAWMLNAMQWSQLEELSGNPPGSYEKATPTILWLTYYIPKSLSAVSRFMLKLLLSATGLSPVPSSKADYHD